MANVEGVTLDNCAREPIHIPGAIQPHGFLLACATAALRVTQVSANVKEHLGLAAEAVIGQSFFALFDAPSAANLRDAIASPSLREANPVQLRAENGSAFDATLHRSGDVLVIEAEPARPSVRGQSHVGFDPRLRASALRLQQSRMPGELMTAAADEVRRLTGFDRVMVYRFDRDWNGEVVAESKRADLGSFMGQHYPASDIPAQARRLYTVNWLRFVGDVNYEPVPLVPALDPTTKAPLDMSHSTLRSVSPIHIEYMKNMGVTASMSISLVVDGVLKGLIACHHYSGPRVVPVTVRDTSEYLGYTLSWQLRVIEDAERQRYVAEAHAHESEIVRSISKHTELIDGLDTAALSALTSSEGAAVVLSEGIRTVGTCPSADQLRALVGWLTAEKAGVFHTDHLEKEYPPAADWYATAGGLLAVPVSRELGEYLLWFRPAVEQTVNWAGAPSKTEVVEGGILRLSPRGSFELWKETVRGRSRVWEEWQIEAASRLRQLLLGGVRRRALQLRTMNQRLMAADRAKDNFIATVSHELRTPLNAISGWTTLLRGKRLDNEKTERGLDVIARNVNAQLQLVEDLLDVSRITSGKLSLDVQEVDLASIVSAAVEATALAVEAKGLELRTDIATAGAGMRGDTGRLRQVVSNLLANAVKFTPKGGAIEVALARNEGGLELQVTDTGQGIEAEFLPHIFEAFRQQDDAMSRRAGGLGLGLAIVHKIVELHGGTITAESDGPGRGATFRLVFPTVHLAEHVESLLPPLPSTRTERSELAGYRILLVEDDDDAREVVEQFLREAKADVVAMSSARDALALLEKERFDVIVSDVGMPEMDGFAFMRAVRKLSSDSKRTPAVALTAYTRAADRLASLQAGFQAHVGKPLDPEELVAVVVSVKR